MVLSLICLVTTQILVSENQTIWKLKILLRTIEAALLITRCNDRFVKNKRYQETGKEYFTIVEMIVKEQHLMPDYAKPSPPSAPQTHTHTHQQKGHCLPNDLCPSHLQPTQVFFPIPITTNAKVFLSHNCPKIKWKNLNRIQLYLYSSSPRNHSLAEREISSASASENKKLIIRLWVHDRRTKVTITGRFIRVLFPVEVTGYICVIEWIYILK